jgi:hypothetical protein
MSREWGKVLNSYSAEEHVKEDPWDRISLPNMRLKEVKIVQGPKLFKPILKLALVFGAAAIIYCLQHGIIAF